MSTAQKAIKQKEPQKQQMTTVQQPEIKTHGITKFVESGPIWKKAMWALIIISSLIGFSIHLGILIIAYKQYKVTTEYKQEANIFEFPAVTICPTNTISPYGKIKNKIPSEFNTTRFNISFHDMMRNVPRVWHTIQNHSVYYRQAFRNYWNARMSLKSIAYRTRLFQAAYETILYCKFNNQPCSYRNFTEYKDPQYFLCFTFTPNNSSVVNSGENSGLYLVLYNKGTAHFTQEEEIDAVEGFVVATHRPNTAPNMRKNIRVPFSYKASAPIEMKKIIKVNRATSPCTDSKHNVIYTTDWSSKETKTTIYTQTLHDCIIRAKQLEFLQQCHCLADHLPIPEDLFSQGTPCHFLNEDIFFMKTMANEISQKKNNKGKKGKGSKKRKVSKKNKRTRKKRKKIKYFYTIQTKTKAPITNLTDFIYGPNWSTFDKFHKNILCFNKVNSKQLQTGIVADCRPDCTNILYDVNSIQMTWPRLGKNPIIKKSLNYMFEDSWDKIEEDNFSTEIIKRLNNTNNRTNANTDAKEFNIKIEQVAVLDMYASSSVVEVLEESFAYELGTLFSDLGGILGLWIGVSILTIAEIIELVVTLIHSVKKKNTGAQQNINVDTQRNVTN